ncbi:MAG: hypothetical protein M1840_007857 [Geoglossum simile]|nr:MAG: hypothetical protein M1840_007857 [Geoglossum simile]
MTPSDSNSKSYEPNTDELRHVLSSLIVSSTPNKAHSDGGKLADSRASSLAASLSSEGKILVEKRSTDGESSMINRYLQDFRDDNHNASASFLTGTTEFNAFIASTGGKKQNEQEFAKLISLITAHLEEKGIADNKFVHSGSRILRSRGGPPGEEMSYSRFGLKPDFFTTKVKFDSSTGTYAPVSLSTLLHPVEAGPPNTPKILPDDALPGPTTGSRNPLSSTGAPMVLTSNGLFAWDDVHTLWEIKSGVQTAASNHKAWANIILKAVEVMRYQSHRVFVIGFLLCGTQLRMFRFDRSCVLVSQPVDVKKLPGEDSSVLVRCILADLVTQYSLRGFAEGSDNPTLVEVDGKLRQVVQVGGKDFILGDQIVWPVEGRLSGRATTVHLACEIGDPEWDYCHKSSWPYEIRQHEGPILEELQDIGGVVDVIAWGSADSTIRSEDILSTYQPYKPPRSQVSQWTSTTTSELKRPSTATGPVGYATQSPSTTELHMRQHRQTVTKYIPRSIADLTQPIRLLQAWRSLCDVIEQIAKRKWVHRDLSWNNIRVCDGDSKSLSVVLIDFDLAAPTERPMTGAPDKTGTPAFMPIEALVCNNFLHQELHEHEGAFWVVFFTAIRASDEGSNMLRNIVLKPGLGLDFVGTQKVSMLSGPAKRNNWSQWICGSSGDDDKEWEVVRNVFLSIANLLLTPQCDYDYTKLYERPMHLQKHQQVLEETKVLLDQAIAALG